MPQSTPLDKIDSHDGQPSDEERVKRIIQEMNAPNDSPGDSHPQGQQQAPPQQYQQEPQYQQMPPPQYQPQYQQMPPQYMQQQQQHVQRQVEEEELVKEEPVAVKKNIWAHIADVLKLPFVVAIVFFLLSLPVVDVYLAKYASWAFSSGGTLTLAGIAVKSLTAGSIMGIYDTLDKTISKFF